MIGGVGKQQHAREQNVYCGRSGRLSGTEEAMEKSCVSKSFRFGIRMIGMTRNGVKMANQRNEDFERLFAIAVQ